MVRTEIERDKAHLDTGLTVRVGAEIMHTQGLRAATYIITPVEPGSLGFATRLAFVTMQVQACSVHQKYL